MHKKKCKWLAPQKLGAPTVNNNLNFYSVEDKPKKKVKSESEENSSESSESSDSDEDK